MPGWEQIQKTDRGASEHSVCLRIGDVTLGFTPASGASILMPGPFSAFKCQGPADLSLRVRHAAVMPALPSGPPLFDSGGTWKLYREPDGMLVFACHSPPLGPAPYQLARVDASFTHGEVLLDPRWFPPSKPIVGLEYPLGELFLQHLLSSRQGVEIHASGIITEDGRGYIFTAQSGGGKTTISHLWHKTQRVRILSDDRLVLRLSDGRVVMHGTPWHGEGQFSEATSVPVTALYFLKQTKSHVVTKLAPCLAVARLLSTSFVPYYDSSMMAACLETLELVVGHVPTYELGFAPDPSVVDFVLGQAS